MAESRSHGSSSLPRKVDEKALARLKEKASDSILLQLQKILGETADLHLVGGSVRDLISGVSSADFDLASASRPEVAKKILEHAGIHVVETGIEHGTITAVVDTQNVEITTFRKPGSRNVFNFSGSIEEDLGGRDFTINAIAYSLERSQIVDPYHGVQDLEDKVLRGVGDPLERFKEDPHRILRMIRFGPAQGRTIDSATREAARALGESLKSVSPERVRVELEKILLSPLPRQGFREIRDLELLQYVLPEFLPCVNFEQNEFHTEDVFEHTLTVVSNAISDRIVKWSALFHDMGKPASLSVEENGRRHFYLHEEISERIADTIMTRLKFSNNDSDQIRKLVRYHMRPMECGPAGVRRIIRDLGEYFTPWRELKIANKTPTADRSEFDKQVERFDTMVSEEKNRKVGSPYDSLAIDGNDLLALGLKQSPRVGKILKALHEAVIEDPELNVKEALLKKALELIKEDAL